MTSTRIRVPSALRLLLTAGLVLLAVAAEGIEHAGVSAGRCCHSHPSTGDNSGADKDFRDHV